MPSRREAMDIAALVWSELSPEQKRTTLAELAHITTTEAHT